MRNIYENTTASLFTFLLTKIPANFAGHIPDDIHIRKHYRFQPPTLYCLRLQDTCLVLHVFVTEAIINF